MREGGAAVLTERQADRPHVAPLVGIGEQKRDGARQQRVNLHGWQAGPAAPSVPLSYEVHPPTGILYKVPGNKYYYLILFTETTKSRSSCLTREYRDGHRWQQYKYSTVYRYLLRCS